MKKTTKLEKRRKTVLGAVLGVGSVALLTTATATYIISISNPSQELGNTLVSVDTVTQDGVEIAFANNQNTLLDSAIFLAETTAIDPTSNVVGWDSTSPEAIGDLTITLPTFTVTYGSHWLDSGNLGIRFSFNWATGANSYNLVGANANRTGSSKDATRGTASSLLAGDEYSDTTLSIPGAIWTGGNNDTWTETSALDKTANYWTYLAAPVDLAGTAGTSVGGVAGATISSAVNADGSHAVTFTGIQVSFRWGTFFNGDSPASYYNSIYTNTGETSKTNITNDIARKIRLEMEDMYNALNGKALVLTMTAINTYGN